MEPNIPLDVGFSSLFQVHENVGDIRLEVSPIFRVYKDGRVEKLIGSDVAAAGVDPETGVESKDVVFSKEGNLVARLYLPKTTSNKKLPLLIYYHGGGFVVETAYSPIYHNHLNLVASQANIVVASVNYRLPPEQYFPVGYEDAWCAIKWVASHFEGKGDEVWLNEHADLGRVFLGGDSAGGNITYNMAMRAGLESLGDFRIEGILLNHAYFWGSDENLGGKPVDPRGLIFFEKMWTFAFPSSPGVDDPKSNPEKEPNLMKLGCSRVFVLIAEQDLLRDRQLYFIELLKKSGWNGSLEIMENEGEDHAFYTLKPTAENSKAVVKRMASFINNKD